MPLLIQQPHGIKRHTVLMELHVPITVFDDTEKGYKTGQKTHTGA